MQSVVIKPLEDTPSQNQEPQERAAVRLTFVKRDKEPESKKESPANSLPIANESFHSLKETEPNATVDYSSGKESSEEEKIEPPKIVRIPDDDELH